MSIGIDIEEVVRFQRLINSKPKLLLKMFSTYEWEYASKKQIAQTLAGIWCAKEAVVKALSQNGFSVSIQNIEIKHNADGVPYVSEIHKLNFDLNKIKISISHTKNFATAVCLVS